MVNYQLGKIYKLVCNDTGMTYYGSTAQSTLAKRLGQHRDHYKGYKKGMCSNYTAFKILENGNYDMILVEDYPCERKEQLHTRERWYIENNDCINKFVPCRTQKEYREKNKEKYIEYIKKYYEDNKEKVNEKDKKYYQDNKEKVLEKMREKIRCDCCNCEINRGSWSAHTRTKKHQANSK